jgi:hypothetical protein
MLLDDILANTGKKLLRPAAINGKQCVNVTNRPRVVDEQERYRR